LSLLVSSFRSKNLYEFLFIIHEWISIVLWWPLVPKFNFATSIRSDFALWHDLIPLFDKFCKEWIPQWDNDLRVNVGTSFLNMVILWFEFSFPLYVESNIAVSAFRNEGKASDSTILYVSRLVYDILMCFSLCNNTCYQLPAHCAI
jgi:hypothetical protein